MNHLAHLALAGDDPSLRLGAFLGDFVKGRLKGDLPPDIETGIRLHRAIDAYTDKHDTVKRAADRFEQPYRRYAGIMLDVVFDYLLANNWPHYYETSLNDFSAEVLTFLADSHEHLPADAHGMAQRMKSDNSLAGYGDVRFLEGAFSRLSGRLTRQNPLAHALDTCLELMPHVEDDFHTFYPELQSFCHDWITEAHSNSTGL